MRGWAGRTTGSSSLRQPVHDPPQSFRPHVRLAVHSRDDVRARRVRWRHTLARDRREAERRVRHHVADDFRASPDALGHQRCDRALVGAEEERRQPVDLDPGSLLRHRQVTAPEARLDVRDRDPERRPPPAHRRASSSCPRGRRPCRASPPRSPREGGRSASRRPRSAGRADARAPSSPSSSMKTCESSSSQCWPGVDDDLVDPGVAQRDRERRRLDELRPVADDGQDTHRASLRGMPSAEEHPDRVGNGEPGHDDEAADRAQDAAAARRERARVRPDAALRGAARAGSPGPSAAPTDRREPRVDARLRRAAAAAARRARHDDPARSFGRFLRALTASGPRVLDWKIEPSQFRTTRRTSDRRRRRGELGSRSGAVDPVSAPPRAGIGATSVLPASSYRPRISPISVWRYRLVIQPAIADATTLAGVSRAEHVDLRSAAAVSLPGPQPAGHVPMGLLEALRPRERPRGQELARDVLLGLPQHGELLEQLALRRLDVGARRPNEPVGPIVHSQCSAYGQVLLLVAR